MADNAKSTDGLPTTSLLGSPLDWVWLGGNAASGESTPNQVRAD